MCEKGLRLPEGYVPTAEQAHAQNLLTVYEAAKLLDLPVLDLVDEAQDGHIEVASHFNKVPCFSLQAVDAYRRGRYSRAS